MKVKYLVFIVLPMLFLVSNCSTPTKNGEEVVIDITSMSEFTKSVEHNAKPVIAKFYAVWCPPCKTMTPIFEKLAEKYKDSVVFASVNIDQNSDISKKYTVKNIPTFIFYKNGEIKYRQIGSLSENDLENLIKKYLLS